MKKERNAKKENILVVLLPIFLFVFALIFVAYQKYRNANLVAQQKNITTTKSLLKEQNRIELAKEITNSDLSTAYKIDLNINLQ